MKSKKKWWILSGVLVVLLAVGIGLSLARAPVDRILTPQEAAGYQVYDVVLPEGESSAFSYVLSCCQTEVKNGNTLYHPSEGLKAALSQCERIVAVSVSEWEGEQFLHLTYEGLDGEDVYLNYREDGTLITRQVYFPARDLQITYEAETGETRLVSPIRFGSGKL